MPATTSSTPVNSQIPAALRPGAGRISYRAYSPTAPPGPAYDTVTPTFQGPPRSEKPPSQSPSERYPGQPIYMPASQSPSHNYPGQSVYRPVSGSPSPSYPGQTIYKPVSNSSAYASAPPNDPATDRAVSISPPPTQRNYRRAPTPFAPGGRTPEFTRVPHTPVYASQAQAPPTPSNPDALPPMPLFVRKR